MICGLHLYKRPVATLFDIYDCVVFRFFLTNVGDTTMNDLINKLVANGYDAYALTLQWIRCKDGSSILAYSTYRASKPANFFGNADVNASCSILNTSQPKPTTSNGNIVTVWLNDADASDEQLYSKTYGRVVAGVVVDGAVELHTAETASQLLPQTDSSSASSSAPF